MFDVDKLIRPHLKSLKPYSSARSEFSGTAEIWLDANESPFDNGVNRYPDPIQKKLRKLVSEQWNINGNQIFIGNGSDEAIDLLMRCFCEPGIDSILICPPTYGMYSVSAKINHIGIVEVPLLESFEHDLTGVFQAVESYRVKMIYLCSPNNPTGTSLEAGEILKIGQNFNGILVVDEAYIHFSDRQTAIELLSELPNLVVLQTLSKAYGLAGIRIGFAFANDQIITWLNRIKPPYNINTLSQQKAIEVLSNRSVFDLQIMEIKRLRDEFTIKLKELEIVLKVYPSDGNFLLVQFENAELTYRFLLQNGVVVRNRHSEIAHCLRLTIGREPEQIRLFEILTELNNQKSKS